MASALPLPASRTIRIARANLASFNDVALAKQRLAALESAVSDLGALLDARDGLDSGDVMGRGRRAALKSLLLDALYYVGPWGRDVTDGDLSKRGRYELDNLFPTRPAKGAAKAGTPVDAVGTDTDPL